MPPSEDDGAVLDGYRTVNGSALLGLLLGLSSVVALVSPILLIVPLAGLLCSWRALATLADRQVAQTGRGLAYFGLLLSVTFGVASPTAAWGDRWFLVQSTQPVIQAWFELLRTNQPEKALQLTLPPDLRRPIDDNLARYYRTHFDAHQRLESFVAEPTTKTLLLLGDRAQVRLYDNYPPVVQEHRESVALVYAVSYDDDGTRTTFFVQMGLERVPDKNGGPPRWRIVQAAGGVHAPSWLD